MWVIKAMCPGAGSVKGCHAAENLLRLLQPVFPTTLLNKDYRSNLHFGMPNCWVLNTELFVFFLVLL